MDSSQLNQVITNLAQNGLRYSQQQTGKATLEFYVHINPLTQLPVLDIIDDGPGIAEDARDKLFEPFYTTEAKGSGLGLRFRNWPVTNRAAKVTGGNWLLV